MDNLYVKDIYGTCYQFKSHSWIKKDGKFMLDDTFHLKRDPTHLLCFTNGVYDSNLCQFRPGKLDDYCTYSTNIDYCIYDHKPLDNILNKLFVDVKQFLSCVYAIFKSYPIVITYNQYEFKFAEFHIIARMFGKYRTLENNNHLRERRIYTCITNLEHLKQHFIGKYVRIDDDDWDSDSGVLVTRNALDYLDNKEHKNIVEIICKTLDSYQEISDEVGNNDTIGIQLMNKLIHIDQSCLKIQLFIHNTIFIPDITNYILTIYDTILY